jgi:hypothetical protein
MEANPPVASTTCDEDLEALLAWQLYVDPTEEPTVNPSHASGSGPPQPNLGPIGRLSPLKEFIWKDSDYFMNQAALLHSQYLLI